MSLEEKITTLIKNDQCPSHGIPFCRAYYEDFIKERLSRGVIWEKRMNNVSKYSKFTLRLTPNQNFSNLNEVKANTLYRPAAENFPLVEFIYKTKNKKETRLFGIQVSREEGGKRSIKASTIYKFLAQLPSNMKFTLLYVPSPQYADNASVSVDFKSLPFEYYSTKPTETTPTETTPTEATSKKIKTPMTILRSEYDDLSIKVDFQIEILKVPINYQVSIFYFFSFIISIILTFKVLHEDSQFIQGITSSI